MVLGDTVTGHKALTVSLRKRKQACAHMIPRKSKLCPLKAMSNRNVLGELRRSELREEITAKLEHEDFDGCGGEEGFWDQGPAGVRLGCDDTEDKATSPRG